MNTCRMIILMYSFCTYFVLLYMFLVFKFGCEIEICLCTKHQHIFVHKLKKIINIVILNQHCLLSYVGDI